MVDVVRLAGAVVLGLQRVGDCVPVIDGGRVGGLRDFDVDRGRLDRGRVVVGRVGRVASSGDGGRVDDRGRRVVGDVDCEGDVGVAGARGQGVGAGAGQRRVLSVQVQPVPLIAVALRPTGRVSVTVTVPVEASGPLFLTEIVYSAPVWPWVKSAGVGLVDDEVDRADVGRVVVGRGGRVASSGDGGRS